MCLIEKELTPSGGANRSNPAVSGPPPSDKGQKGGLEGGGGDRRRILPLRREDTKEKAKKENYKGQKVWWESTTSKGRGLAGRNSVGEGGKIEGGKRGGLEIGRPDLEFHWKIHTKGEKDSLKKNVKKEGMKRMGENMGGASKTRQTNNRKNPSKDHLRGWVGCRTDSVQTRTDMKKWMVKVEGGDVSVSDSWDVNRKQNGRRDYHYKVRWTG